MKPKKSWKFTNADFFRSSSCVYPPGGCVEVAIKPGFVAVRDGKDRTKKPLVFTAHEWAVFVQGVKAGEFDQC